MKDYFIQFDFWDDAKTFNKFYYGVVNCDLSNEQLRDVCRQIIKRNFNMVALGANIDEIVIKVNALNNISTKAD